MSFYLLNTIGLSESIKKCIIFKNPCLLIKAESNWTLVLKPVSGNDTFHFNKGFFFLFFIDIDECKFARHSDSIWEPSDMMSFGNVTSFVRIFLSFLLYSQTLYHPTIVTIYSLHMERQTERRTHTQWHCLSSHWPRGGVHTLDEVHIALDDW